MYLFEYQAKALMREWGIPVLEGMVATSERRALDVARELGEGPWVVKAQIHAGGRAQGRVDSADDLSGVEFTDTVLDWPYRRANAGSAARHAPDHGIR